MSYKLLAVDLDGTLLRRDGSIHHDDLGAIQRLRAAGVPVTIVTGRLYSGTRKIACSIGIEGPIACVDGSHIVDTRDNRSLYERTILGEHALSVRRILSRHRPASFVFTHDGIVHDAKGIPFVPYVSGWSPTIVQVPDIASHPHWAHEAGLLAVVAVGIESEIVAAVEELRADLAHVASVVHFAVQRFEGLFGMVIRAAGSTKGTALKWLAQHHGCLPSEVVAIGDWLNDLPMFEAAGRSFVMAQAPEAVKIAATDRLEASVKWGGGVAEAVDKVWGSI